MYWFRRAHDELAPGKRAGLVGTNTIRQNYSREGGLDYIVANGGRITNAVSTQVWSGDAAVHVSIVGVRTRGRRQQAPTAVAFVPARYPRAPWNSPANLSAPAVTADDVRGFVDGHPPEGDTLELKEAIPSRAREGDPWTRGEDRVGDHGRNEILAEVIGFANAHGGIVLLGVRESVAPAHSSPLALGKRFSGAQRVNQSYANNRVGSETGQISFDSLLGRCLYRE